ncbi:MAG: HNH endonuclease signature motif containing protein [Planctomycetaceae bacterium]
MIKKAYWNKFPDLRPVLDELFPVRLPDDEGDNDESGYHPEDQDLRRTVERQIKERRGQQNFRTALRDRFNDQCVITGCRIVDILEAAHICPYRGTKDNKPENGLLLRADIHTLFDLNLLGINHQTLKVELHPNISGSEYGDLNGQRLRIPKGMRVSAEALKERYGLFKDALGS